MDVTKVEPHLGFLREIAEEDTSGLLEAYKHYGDSWKKRGGVGAFMMLARKWDRIELRVGKVGVEQPPGAIAKIASAWDIFAHIEADDRSEGLIDDVRDLRRYLLLVEAEMRARNAPAAMSKHRDNKNMGGHDAS